MPNKTTIRAFAPATIGNVGVGFDILGFPIEGVGDEVEATLVAEQEKPVVIKQITGFGADSIPRDATKNTAALAALSLIKAHGGGINVALTIKKGIPLSSGMGGSAASSVAAVVAVNELLTTPLAIEKLIPFALAGETIASGGDVAHGDNVVPCLLGGLRLCFPVSMQSLGVPISDFSGGIELPVPENIFCVLCKPDIAIETSSARGILKDNISLQEHTHQSACLGGFITACHTGEIALLQLSLRDLLIEPQRQKLIPGFSLVKKAALDAGALGCSISGAGPSLFAWTHGADVTKKVESAMTETFKAGELASRSWVSPVSSQGAKVIL